MTRALGIVAVVVLAVAVGDVRSVERRPPIVVAPAPASAPSADPAAGAAGNPAAAAPSADPAAADPAAAPSAGPAAAGAAGNPAPAGPFADPGAADPAADTPSAPPSDAPAADLSAEPAAESAAATAQAGDAPVAGPSSAPAGPLAAPPRRPLPAVPGCRVTGLYDIKAPPPTGLSALYVDPALGAGGPVAAVLGDDAVTAVADPVTDADALANGARHATWSTGEDDAVLRLGSKRMAADPFATLAEHVDDTAAPLPSGLVELTPATTGARVRGSACERGQEFYGVEWIQGTLAERVAWMLNTDPSAAYDQGDVTLAFYGGPAGGRFDVRDASASEWTRLGRAMALPERARTAMAADE